MINASHNPGQYNGMKFCRAKAFPISLDSGLDAIRDLAVRGDFPTPVHTGQVRKHEIIDAYVKHVISFIDVNKVKPLKVVIDAGNGMAGRGLPPTFMQLTSEL